MLRDVHLQNHFLFLSCTSPEYSITSTVDILPLYFRNPVPNPTNTTITVLNELTAIRKEKQKEKVSLKNLIETGLFFWLAL